MMQIDLGFKLFQTKRMALDHFTEMLNRYSPGVPISEADQDELKSLILRHHNAAEKTGPGIQSIKVVRDAYGKWCFAIQRTDGTATDFSLRKCINGVPDSPFQNVAKALRHCVEGYMIDYRKRLVAEFGDAHQRVPCAITGDLISWREAHLDHIAPDTFEKLVERFLLDRKLLPENIALADKRDISFGRSLVDEALEADFYTFHERYARLRLIKKEENLSLGPKFRDRNHTWAAGKSSARESR